MSTEFYPFRYRNPITGKWVKARHKATREDIAKQHEEIIGPGEHPADLYGSGFNPYRVTSFAEVKRLFEPEPELGPEMDERERFLVALFLRRYVTWCCRSRRFAQMQGAARLWREVKAQEQ